MRNVFSLFLSRNVGVRFRRTRPGKQTRALRDTSVHRAWDWLCSFCDLSTQLCSGAWRPGVWLRAREDFSKSAGDTNTVWLHSCAEFKMQTNDHKRKTEKANQETGFHRGRANWRCQRLGGGCGLRSVLAVTITVVYASVESLNSAPEIHVALCVN